MTTYQNKTYHILVAEDVELNFKLVNTVLSKFEPYNFIIHRAENGKEAVTICDQKPNIDLVIMDIRMPIMDGYQATKIIKEKYKELPVLAHTAYCNDNDIQNALNAGCDVVIPKPLNLKEFKTTISSYIEKNHIQ